ncbi:uncharacterized protein [Dysidea avara]|uniref:uncharacterized protein n=1 Tax=Dysidea avara TaxID=196820 RepID=UPI00332DA6AE
MTEQNTTPQDVVADNSVYHHERSKTIVVSLTPGPQSQDNTQVGPPTSPPPYNQSIPNGAPLPPADIPVPQEQPPPAYDADPSKQHPQKIQCQPSEIIVEQPRQIQVIATSDYVHHDYLPLSIVVAILCCFVSLPTLVCSLPAIVSAAIARDRYNSHGDDVGARRFNYLAIILNLLSVLTGIVLLALVIILRVTV